jgi:peptide/nickel transport system permease protein
MGLLYFVIRRTITFLPTLLGVLFISYIIAYVIPANPVRAWIGGQRVTDLELLERIRRDYYFDRPWYEQFYFLVSSLLSGSLMDPIRHKPVFEELSYRFPITVELAILGFLFTLIVSLPLGFLAARFKDTIIDFLVRFLALFGSSMPSFVLYYFLILAFFVATKSTYLAGIPYPSASCIVFINNLPSSLPIPLNYLSYIIVYVGAVPMFGAMICGEFNVVYETLFRLWLPALSLGLLNGGFIARILRNSLLDALSSEYILYAKARGLSSLRVWSHAFKNSLIPVITVLGINFGSLLTGAVIAETVFNIPGIGRYTFEAIIRLNFPGIIAATFLFGLVYIIVNFIIDIFYGIIDPRIRYK